MNSIQFGRWFSEWRRACGWLSQRLLVEAAQQHPHLQKSGISEDFLARLEAGRLAYPFRSTVRWRLFLLSWLLCKTPRDLKTYLKAAGLSDLSDKEKQQLHQLQTHLELLQTPPMLLLPPHPGRLYGRNAEKTQLLHMLSNPDHMVIALTGMPGVGKSALACEVLYGLLEDGRCQRFPDGIVALTCTGRQGTRGLISLLREIIDLFATTEQRGRALKQRMPTKDQSTEAISGSFELEADAELAAVIDRARAVLANKRMLLLLDDLDAAFPLRQALDVLLTSGTPSEHAQQVGRVILTASRFIPAPALVPARLHLQSLEEKAALELLTDLLGEELSEQEQISARQTCAALGYLPLAIENAATAVQVEGIPLALVATHLLAHPLHGLQRAEAGMMSALEQMLAGLDHQAREQYILLAALGVSSFDLEAAAAILSPQPLPMPDTENDEEMQVYEPPLYVAQFPKTREADELHALTELFPLNGPNKQKILAMTYGEHIPDLVMAAPIEQEREKVAHLANTAAVLGQFVRHSLLELSPDERAMPSKFGAEGTYTPGRAALSPASSLHDSPQRATSRNAVNYQMHALFRSYARELARTLPVECLELARHNLLSYALNYASQHEGDVLEPEHTAGLAVVLAGLEFAWREQHYTSVIRLTRSLLPLSMRMAGDDGERLLQRGLYASQQIHDQKAIILFLDHLACLHCYRGDLLVARQMWEAALHVQERLDPSPGCWRPLAGLAHLAHIQGDFQAAWRFSEAYVRKAERMGDRESIILARSRRAFYARLLGRNEQAHGDLLTSLSLLREDHLLHAPGRELLEMETRTELARVEGDYPRAQSYAEAAIAITRDLCNQYNVADLLYDQACFALEQGLLEDARKLARQAAETAVEVGATHFYKNSMRLLQEI